MRCEAGDGCKFPATFECLYKCSRRRRAQGLVYVACISPTEEVASTLVVMAVGSTLAWLLLADNGGMGQRGVIHNPVWAHLLPQRMILPQYMIVHPILVKMTLQPALHRARTKMKEWEARPGMIWACCAEAGRAGMLRVHVCLECTHSPFGSWAMMGLLVGRMLVMGAAVLRK
jgi:hypothetical protein